MKNLFLILGLSICVQAADVRISDLPSATNPSDNTLLLISDMDAVTKSQKYALTNLARVNSPELTGNPKVNGQTIAPLSWSQLAGREWQKFVTVSTTISNAVAAITDANVTNRYLVYIPNGTYDEYFSAKLWVDFVGESRAGVVITNNSQAADTVNINGFGTMLANMTIIHTTAPGETQQYPVHADGNTPGLAYNVLDYVLINCSLIANGGDGKSGVGIGLSGGQSFRAYGCSFSSDATAGIFIHNENTETKPVYAYFVDCTATATGSGQPAIGINSIGSGQVDKIFILGGSYTGDGDGIRLYNTGSGADEWVLVKDSNVEYSSISPGSFTVITSDVPLFAASQRVFPNLFVNGHVVQGGGNVAMNHFYAPATGKTGINISDPDHSLEVLNTNTLIAIYAKQFNTNGATSGGYFQNSLNVSTNDTYGLQVQNSNAGSGTHYGIRVLSMAGANKWGLFLSNSPAFIGGTLLHQIPIESKTSDYTLVIQDSAKAFNNAGATALVTLTLPDANTGYRFSFYVDDADGIRVQAVGNDTIRIGSSVSGTAGSVETTTIGSWLTIESISNAKWVATVATGGWLANSTIQPAALLAGDGTAAAPSLGWLSDADGSGTGFYLRVGNTIGISLNGVGRYNITSATFDLPTAGSFGWSSGAVGSNKDVALERDAANTLALRNGANAQAFRWYHTYTDSSNYQRGALKTDSTSVIVSAETLGSGADNIDVVLAPAGTGSVKAPVYTITGTTNQVIFGATNSAPSDTATIVRWISVQVAGESEAYRTPLYK